MDQIIQFLFFPSGRDSSAGRATDSWSKGSGFDLRHRRQEKFRRLTFCLDSYSVSVPPPPPPPGHSARSTNGRLKNFISKHRLLTQRSRSGLTMLSVRVGTFPGKRVHTQLVRVPSSTVVSACWATVDWSWPKERNWCAGAHLHFPRKKSAGSKWFIEPSRKIFPCKEKATTTARNKVSLWLTESKQKAKSMFLCVCVLLRYSLHFERKHTIEEFAVLQRFFYFYWQVSWPMTLNKQLPWTVVWESLPVVWVTLPLK